MEMNYYAIALCGVLSMVIGAVWYGPLFGRKWMAICKVSPTDVEARKKMQKEAGTLYAVQFVLTIYQLFALNYFILNTRLSGVHMAIWIWSGFVMPTIAGSAMWNNDSKSIKWARFLLQSGYELVVFIVFGFVLSMWK